MNNSSVLSGMRAIAVTVGLALFAGCSQSFVVAHSAEVDPTLNMRGAELFDGQVKIDGTYEYFEDGEPCFEVSRASAKSFPYWNGTEDVRVCFSNAEQAIDLFNITQAIDSVDTERICGLQGQATIRLSGLWTGMGPATRWYTSRLLDVSNLRPYVFIKCPSQSKGTGVIKPRP